MPELIPFQFHSTTVSTITNAQGETWFIAADSCKALGIENVSQAVSRLDTDEKTSITLNDVLHSELKTLIISESGLYSLVLSSRKKIAKEFKRWVTHEVLPQIRKTGKYDTRGIVTVDPRIEKYPELRAIADLLLATAEARDLAEIANAKADVATGLARLALEGQEWLTIRQYVAIYGLERQLPESQQGAYSTWLKKQCLAINMPIYEMTPVDRKWTKENTYHSGTIKKTLLAWLSRREGQGNLLVLPVEKEGRL